MSLKKLIVLLALAWILTAARTRAADAEVDVEALRPGLVAVYRDTTNSDASPAVEVVQLEPAVTLILKAGEAAHPRLRGDGGTLRWTGYLNVLRAGTYRFSARLRGKFRLQVAGKEVLAAEVGAPAPALREGPETRLEGGIFPLSAEFNRMPGDARIELYWQSTHFRRELLSYQDLFHLPNQIPDRLTERGRFLAEEHNCVHCHQPADDDRIAKGLHFRPGPDLSEIGKRAFAGWIYHWLESPRKIQPGARMPRLFQDDETGRVERYAVARYLATLGSSLKPAGTPPKPQDLQKWTSRGQTLFASIGCLACHPGEKDKGKRKKDNEDESYIPFAVARFPLAGLAGKTTPEKLAAYLANPLAIDPSGRMPHMLLKKEEARDLAYFLCQGKDKEIGEKLPTAPAAALVLDAFKKIEARLEEQAGFERLNADAQLLDLGKRLVIDKGCNNCHTIAPGGKPFASVLARASFPEIKKPTSSAAGCLADEPARRGPAPWFDWDGPERLALRAFLREGTVGAGSPAPAHAAQETLRRFNCLACHVRDGTGGLTPSLVDELRRHEKIENAEALSPPPLTGVGHRLRASWMKQVLAQGGRARPWMGLRMPQFGAANVGPLPDLLAALDGTEPDDRVYQVPLTANRLEAGRRLIGKQALGCTSCHDLAGVVTGGTRGPDLALMNQRIRYEWYRLWLEQAHRMQPGTRMPTIFPDGKSPLANILDGSAAEQADAMWAFLSLGMNLPLPDDLREPPKGLVLAVKDRPVLLRTFMPDASTRAIAVGLPGGISYVFDAATCRLAYAWSGNFLEASGAWKERGGSSAKLLGKRFWTAPPGCPIGVSDANVPPDYAAHARDPAHGAPLPDGKVLSGARQLLFEKYEINKDGNPIFHYRVEAGSAAPLEVSERVEPLRGTAAVGLVRHFALQVPAQRTVWFHAGDTTQEPRYLDAAGVPATLDWKVEVLEFSPKEGFLLLPQGNERPVVLALATVPEGTKWRLLRRPAGGWQALLRLPQSPEAVECSIALKVWAPFSDTPDMVKEVLPGK